MRTVQFLIFRFWTTFQLCIYFFEIENKKIKKNSAFFSKLQLVKEIVFSRTDLGKKKSSTFFGKERKNHNPPF